MSCFFYASASRDQLSSKESKNKAGGRSRIWNPITIFKVKSLGDISILWGVSCDVYPVLDTNRSANATVWSAEHSARSLDIFPVHMSLLVKVVIFHATPLCKLQRELQKCLCSGELTSLQPFQSMISVCFISTSDHQSKWTRMNQIH